MSIESTSMEMESVPPVTFNMRPYKAEVTAESREDIPVEAAIDELRRLGARDIKRIPGQRVVTGLFEAPSDLVLDLHDQAYAPYGNEPQWLPGERERLVELRAQAAAASGRTIVGAEADRNIY